MKTNHLCQPSVETDSSLRGQEEIYADVKVSGLLSGLEIQDILDAIPFYVLLIDSDHYILGANRAVKSQLGVEPEDILGQYCPLIIHQMEKPFEGCPLEEAVEKDTAVERELFDEKTGRWLVSAIYPTGSLTQNGKKIFLHMVIDITERKQAQDQLRLSHIQLRNLSAHMETVREEEKRKIARDLHDETSQVLASLHAYLETAISTLPENAAKPRELLKKAQTLATTILDEIRKLIYELHPTALDELGLMPAIFSLAQNNLKTAGIEVSVKTAGKVRRVPSPIETALFRIVQEAFNNIIKHAQARHVNVRVSFLKAAVKISIKDDGRGFDIQQTAKMKDMSGGMGLIGIRERVLLMNGVLSINSKPGQGTEIRIEVPVPEKDSDE